MNTTKYVDFGNLIDHIISRYDDYSINLNITKIIIDLMYKDIDFVNFLAKRNVSFDCFHYILDNIDNSTIDINKLISLLGKLYKNSYDNNKFILLFNKYKDLLIKENKLNNLFDVMFTSEQRLILSQLLKFEDIINNLYNQ